MKKPDRIPRTYDHRPFTLDGRMDLDVTFNGTTMRTQVYIKMDAREPLLLSEGVCRQLGIISYHPDLLTHAERNKVPALRSLGEKNPEVKAQDGTGQDPIERAREEISHKQATIQNHAGGDQNNTGLKAEIHNSSSRGVENLQVRNPKELGTHSDHMTQPQVEHPNRKGGTGDHFQNSRWQRKPSNPT